MIQGVPDDQRAGQRGAVDRVAVVRRQARQTLAIAVVFAIGAPVVALFHHDTGTWLPLHVFLVGGVLAAISGAAPMLAVTWSASPAPSAVLAGVQRWVLACGAVAITVGRETGHTPLVAFGGTAVMVALVLLGVILLTIRRHVTTTRYMPAIDAYLVAVVLGIGGSAL
ncbi:MAG: hypothetical protein ABIQ39_10245, partial [Ilumatobacteraceae bacterium]